MARLALSVLFVLAAAGSAAAQSARPVALALQIEGATEPALEAFSELTAGQRLRLRDGAEIEFLHYPTCETVTVKGGDLSFSERRYSVRGGEIADVKRSKCPKIVAPAGDSQIGGVVLRSPVGPRVLSLTTRPGFVVVGSKRRSYTKVRILLEGQIVHESALTGNRFEWPSRLEPLDPDGNYTLELLSADGETRAFAFRTEERRGEPPLAVVRLD